MTTELTAREAPASYVLEALRVRPGYKCPKGYKQTEVGAVPEDWEVKQFSDIAETDPDNLGSSTAIDFSFNYISLEDVDAGRLMSFSEQVFGTAPSRARRKLRKNDVLVSTVRPNLKSHLLFSLDNASWICSTGFSVVRCNENLAHPGYIYSHLFADTISRQIEGLLTGSNYPAINGRDIRALKIPVPPTKTEQQAIAEALSDADALIEALEQLVAKKRQLKQGAMQELLTGKKRLPGFGGEWEVKSLGELFQFSGGLSASREQLSSEGHCYLHYGDIHGAYKTYIDVRAEFADIPKLEVPLGKVSSSSLLDDGDVVFVDASEDDEGASKHVVVVNPNRTPFISGLHTIVAKSKTDELAHLYRRYCFQTAEVKVQFRFFAVGTKVSGISKTNIAKITLSFPDIEEQTAIATLLSDMDAEIAALESQLAKARGIKQGMMQELLTGRIRLV